MKIAKARCDGCGKEFFMAETGQVEFVQEINGIKMFYTFDFCATCGTLFCMELLENYIKDSKIQTELIESLIEKRKCYEKIKEEKSWTMTEKPNECPICKKVDSQRDINFDFVLNAIDQIFEITKKERQIGSWQNRVQWAIENVQELITNKETL